MRVTVAMYSLGPRVQHFCEADAVGFQVLDSTGSESARGKFTDPIEAATMPRLRRDVEYSSLREVVDTLRCPRVNRTNHPLGRLIVISSREVTETLHE